MGDCVDNALLDALRGPRLALEVNHCEVEEQLSFLLDNLLLADCLHEVLHDHVHDHLDCPVGE